MIASYGMDEFIDNLDDLSDHFNQLCDEIMKMRGQDVDVSLIGKLRTHMSNHHAHFDHIKVIYNKFTQSIAE